MVRPLNSLPPTPCPSLHHTTDADFAALYAYVTSLGPAGTPAPAALTADRSSCQRSAVSLLADSPRTPRGLPATHLRW